MSIRSSVIKGPIAIHSQFEKDKDIPLQCSSHVNELIGDHLSSFIRQQYSYVI